MCRLLEFVLPRDGLLEVARALTAPRICQRNNQESDAFWQYLRRRALG